MRKIILLILVFAFISNVYADKNEITYSEYQKVFYELNSSYDLFIGACSNLERVAIIEYADGNLEALSGGYDTIKSLTTQNGKTINDVCANYAEDLYEAIKSGEEYVGKNTMYSLNLETEIEIKKNVFVVGSKIQSRDDLTIIDDCNLIDKKFKDVLNEYFGYLEIACVSITIILCITDVYKLLVSKDLDSKKAFKNIKGRIIALVIILLIPVIINIIIGLINNYVDVEAIKCLES